MKHFDRISKVIFLQLFFFQFISAQTSSQSIIPPSPAAMVFQKYVDYPIDISTGTPQISVPLYTIQLKDYTFPVSASFHASGRRPDFNFSPLGMNWALVASGVINREIRGRPDESITQHVENPASFYFPQSQHADDLMAIDPVTTWTSGFVSPKDNEYDIYSLTVNGISTKFIIKDNGTIVFLTYSPFKLTGSLSSNFVLTDDKGIVYTFNFTEIDASNPLITKPSSWYLTSIITPSGSSITFSYVHPSVFPATWLGNRIYKDLGELKDGDTYNANSCNSYGCGGNSSLFSQYFNSQDGFYKNLNVPVEVNDYNMCYLKEINFDNGKISFSYPPTTTGGDFLLNSCTVTTSQNKVIKNIDFSYYSYLPGTDLNLFNNNSRTIQDITFKDMSNTAVEKYSFDYYPGNTGGDVASFAKAKDLWGYCNSSTSGTTQIPVASVHIEHSGSSYNQNTNGNVNSKIPNLGSKLVGMVKTIHYPTGGSTTFTYEANRILDHTGTEIDGPGIRVQEIVADDGIGHLTGKTYSYSGGIAAVIPSVANDYFIEKRAMIFSGIDFNYNTSQTFDQAFVGSYKYRQYSSDPVAEVASASGYPVYYQSVTEYDYSSNNKKNGRIIYQYSYPEYDKTNSYISYPTQYGSTFISSGTTDYFTPQVVSFQEFTKPQLESKIIQKYDNATSTYKTVSSTSINYTNLNTIDVPQISLYKFIEFPTDNPNSSISQQKTAMTNANLNWQVYTILDRTIHSAVMKPSSETTTTYGDNGVELTQTTNYYYDNLVHVNPTRIVTTSSDSKTLTHYISYPGDYTGSIDSYSSLPIENVTVQTKNGVTGVISGQIATYTNNVIDHLYKLETATLIGTGSFKFSNRTTGILPPAGSAASFAKDSRYTLKSVFIYDVNNNPLSVTPTDNNSISYFWGYNRSYPIAKVVNASFNEIFFEPFEENIGWDGTTATAYGDTPISAFDKTMSHTGKASGRIDKLTSGEKYCHSSQTLNISLTAAKKFKVSGWVFSNGPSVDIYLFMKKQNESSYFSYIDNLTTSTTNKWVYVEKEFTVPSDVVKLNLRLDNNGGGTVWFDDIRLHPSASQMTTYTYDPLIGMTSATDPNNRTTYYEYDDFGRLILVKDQDKNIVKKICYNYAGQPGDCSINTDPVWTATGNLRCQTNSSGNTGYQEREEVDQNHSSTTFNQTRWVQDAYNTTACPLPAPPCTISINYGFTNATNSIYNNGTSVQFYMAFYSNTIMNPGTSYYVGNITGSCRPSVTRTINYSSGSQNWTITIDPSGAMYWYLNYGSTQVPAYSTIGTSTLTYNL